MRCSLKTVSYFFAVVITFEIANVTSITYERVQIKSNFVSSLYLKLIKGMKDMNNRQITIRHLRYSQSIWPKLEVELTGFFSINFEYRSKLIILRTNQFKNINTDYCAKFAKSIYYFYMNSCLMNCFSVLSLFFKTKGR